MSIEAINEQLLRAMGVGVALFDAQDLSLRFRNDVFESWFGPIEEGAALPALFSDLDLGALRAQTGAGERYAAEIRFRKKRRTLVIAQVFTRALVGDETVLVLECQNITRIRELETMIESYAAMVERNTREIEREKERVEKLLLSIMPRAAYDEYKSLGVVSPHRHESVTALSLDFCGFSTTIEQTAPATLVGELNTLYGAFDRIGEQLGCERLRTTGDSYLCLAGMREPGMDHAAVVAGAAQRFVRFLSKRNANAETAWICRIGVGTGPVVGSVVGEQRYVYDVFGPGVDAAAAARVHAEPMEILLAPTAAEAVSSRLTLTPPASESARAAGFMALKAED